MSQANLTNLVSKLRIRIRPVQRQFAQPEGPIGRLKLLRRTVTALVQHERIELNYQRGDEARGFAERLISEAIRYGDCHRPTMKLATFWLEDEALVPKLFKVLVPRYESWPSGLPYTRMLRAPSSVVKHKDIFRNESPGRAVLELRGNPYPPLPGPVNKTHPGLIHNVLLEEARKDYFKSQSYLAQQVELEVQAIPNEETCHLENASALVDGLESLADSPQGSTTNKEKS